MEDNSNGRRPKCRMNQMEDSLNERRPKWKTSQTAQMEGDPNGIRTFNMQDNV